MGGWVVILMRVAVHVGPKPEGQAGRLFRYDSREKVSA